MPDLNTLDAASLAVETTASYTEANRLRALVKQFDEYGERLALFQLASTAPANATLLELHNPDGDGWWITAYAETRDITSRDLTDAESDISPVPDHNCDWLTEFADQPSDGRWQEFRYLELSKIRDWAAATADQHLRP